MGWAAILQRGGPARPPSPTAAASAATVRWSSNCRALRRIPWRLARAAIWNRWIESAPRENKSLSRLTRSTLRTSAQIDASDVFERRLRRRERLLLRRGDLRRGQRGAIKLAVRRHRQGVEPHPDRRESCNPASPRLASRATPRPTVPLPKPRPDSRPASACPALSSRRATAAASDAAGQHRLDLLELDAEPAQLNLRVRAAKDLDFAARQAPSNIAGAVRAGDLAQTDRE